MFKKSPVSYSRPQESEFYYLKSRYYDPAICRFINADGLASTGQGFLGANMFAYCGNNPVVYFDDGGTRPKSYDETVDELDDSDCFFLFSDSEATGPQQFHGSGSVQSELETAASSASASIEGTGHVVGTHKHAVFSSNVNDLNIRQIATEISYMDGVVVPYGTKGSIRFDVLLFDEGGIPVMAWDYKTGSAVLSQTRINQMIRQSGLSIGIYELR